jgi:hypothetical protein
VLDEPTVGLHMADVDKLIRVLHRLVERRPQRGGDRARPGPVIAEADWIIDLGPEGGHGRRAHRRWLPERPRTSCARARTPAWRWRRVLQRGGDRYDSYS